MNDIDHAAFRRLDLNLLIAFDALVAEAGVTRAAARLCIGQPAMSHALGRLREFFKDELLYRDGAAMRPTERALALAPRIRALLGEIQALAAAGTAFDPAQVEGRFRIALTDPLEVILLPGLVARLRAKAPGLSLSVRPVPAPLQLEHLDQGNIRLAVGHFPRIRETHEALLLHRSGFSCIYNPALLDLPSLSDPQALTRFPHIHSSYAGEAPGIVDHILQQHGLQRHLVAQAAMPLSIPFVVKQSPLLAVLPDFVTGLFRAHEELRIEPLPLPGLELPISMVSHRRDRGDPLTRFVMEQVVDVAGEVFGCDGAVRA